MVRVELESRSLRLTIDPALGAAITRLDHRDPSDPDRWHPILRTALDASSSADASCFLMAPWPNRVAGAEFEFDGHHVKLDPNHDDGAAIHGFFRDRAFRVLDRSPHSARLIAVHTTSPTWPWACTLAVTYTLIEHELEMDLRLTNQDASPMPCGLGWHPFFKRRLATRDSAGMVPRSARLRLPRLERYPAKGCIPVGRPARDGLTERLAVGDEIDAFAPLDDVFTRGDEPMEIDWPESDVAIRLTTDAAFNHAVVFAVSPSEPSLSEVFCVEPCTMVNDAINLHARGWQETGLRVLEPGDTLRARWALAIRCTESSR
ncbi:MAG: hypothetical protein AAGK04_02805 [Planctomycetota bacterium]